MEGKRSTSFSSLPYKTPPKISLISLSNPRRASKKPPLNPHSSCSLPKSQALDPSEHDPLRYSGFWFLFSGERSAKVCCFMDFVVVSPSEHASVVSITLFVALLCACIVIGHLLEESRWMNESITALAIVSCLEGFRVCKGFCFFVLDWYSGCSVRRGFVLEVFFSLRPKGGALVFWCSARSFSLYIYFRRLYLMLGEFLSIWFCLRTGKYHWINFEMNEY